MDDQIEIDQVRQDMFAILHGQETPLLTRWRYRADDPFAITMSISRRNGRWIDWLMSRELLVAGLVEEAGIGDVRFTPYEDGEFDVLEVRIGDDDGSATLEFDRELVERFVNATYEIVAAGEEPAMIDVEAEIEKLTDTCFG